MRTKQKQEWGNVKISKTNGDYAKLQKQAEVRKMSLIQLISLLINK